MTTHARITGLMSHLDDIKETLDDGVYLTIVNSLMEIKKTESCFYKVVLQNMHSVRWYESEEDTFIFKNFNDKTTFYLKGVDIEHTYEYYWGRCHYLDKGQIPTQNGKPIYAVGDVIYDKDKEQHNINSVILEITKVD